MYIDNVVVHNWANLPDDVYELGPLNLVTGGNGSGKTTFGDAIQTAMTATLHGLFQYNPGQDESSQQSKKKKHRTLASYVLGCDDYAYARTKVSDSYIVINWKPSASESGDKFCCLIACRAHLNESAGGKDPVEDRLDFYLLHKEHLSIEDLKTNSGKNWLDLEKGLKANLVLKYGKSVVEDFNQKTHFLCRFYAMLAGKSKGSLSAPEMRQRAKAFSKFMAYQPVDNLNVFVRESILEAPDNDSVISEISSMMRNITSMRQEAEQVNVAISALEKSKDNSHLFIEKWLKHQENYAVALLAKSHLLQEQYLGARKRKGELEENIRQADRAIQGFKKDRKSKSSQVSDMKARLKGTGWEQKEKLEEQMEDNEQVIADVGVELLTVSSKIENLKQAILHNTNYLQNRVGTDGHKLLTGVGAELSDSLEKIEKLSDFPKLIKAGDFEGEKFEALLDDFLSAELVVSDLCVKMYENHGDEESLSNKLQALKFESARRYKNLEEQKQDLEDDINRLTTNKSIRYPQATTRALSELKKRFPKCNPRIVGDNIEINDRDWQNSIEGYLGGARFNIVVDPEFETDAIKLVKKLAGNAKVVQGEKAKRDIENRRLSNRSIVHFMDIEDELVRAYITANYWNVDTADSAEQLRGMRRGLTQDGMGCSSYSMYKCFIEDEQLMCGDSARERRLSALKINLKNKFHEIEVASDYSRECDLLAEHAGKIVELNAVQSLEKGLDAIQKKSDLENQLSMVDLSDGQEIQEKLEQLEEDVERIENDIERETTNRGGFLTELNGHTEDDRPPSEGSLVKKIKRLSIDREKFSEDADERVILYLDWRKAGDDFNEGDIIDAIESAAKLVGAEELIDLLNSFNKTQKFTKSIIEIGKCVVEYNQVAIQQQTLSSPYEDIQDVAVTDGEYFVVTRRLLSDVDRNLSFLKNHILAKNIDTLRKAQNTFDQTFTTSLVQQILSHIDSAKKSLTNINKELMHHKFDDETFEFTWDRQREFKDYYSCFQELVKLAPARRSEARSIFEDDEISENARGVLNTVKGLLLQDDNSKAKRELQRISDYRNYFTYDILKKPEGKDPIPLSTYGTGSGGQLETPFYVIMAAAFQSVLKFQEGGCHLRTIVIDESFSKLDEKRSRRILNYLTEKLALQVIFIMPTVKSGPFKPMCTNQLVMHKVTDLSPPLGSELKTKVYVDQQKIKGEQVDKLYDRHREAITRQVQHSFLNLVDEIEATGA